MGPVGLERSSPATLNLWEVFSQQRDQMVLSLGIAVPGRNPSTEEVKTGGW